MQRRRDWLEEDRWAESGEERGRSREFTSTPLARHSAPDCDIYPPSLTNPMLLPPTRFDLSCSLHPALLLLILLIRPFHPLLLLLLSHPFLFVNPISSYHANHLLPFYSSTSI